MHDPRVLEAGAALTTLRVGILAGMSTTSRAPIARLAMIALLALIAGAGVLGAARPAAAADDTVAFCDVPASAFYADAVAWANSVDVVAGFDERTFAPLAPTTRGQIVTLLHRFVTWRDGAPAVGSHSFADVPDGAFFDEAVGWALAAGITSGRTPSTFHPHHPTTREEMAAFLHRLQGADDAWPITTVFSDLNRSSFAVEVSWLYDSGVTTGTSSTTFSPERVVTRSELVTFLWRLAGRPGPARPVPTPVCADSFTAIGDSVMAGAELYGDLTPSSFPGFRGVVDTRECRQAAVDVRSGCGTTTTIPSALSVIRDQAAAGRLGDIVVMHVGHNGAFDDTTFDALVNAAGSAHEVWFMSISTNRSSDAVVNARLAAGVERWEGRRTVGLLDWAAIARADGGLTAGDDTHLTPAGAEVYTDLIGTAVR